MNLPLISILQLNQAEMSIVMQALLVFSRRDKDTDAAERADALLDRIEDKLGSDDRQE